MGVRLANDVAEMESIGPIVPVGMHYYFITDKLASKMKILIGTDGSTDWLPFDVFLANRQGEEFTAHFKIRVFMKGGVMSIHTQHFGVEHGGWKRS